MNSKARNFEGRTMLQPAMSFVNQVLRTHTRISQAKQFSSVFFGGEIGTSWRWPSQATWIDRGGSRDAGRALPAFLQPPSTFVLAWSPHSPPRRVVGPTGSSERNNRKKGKRMTGIWKNKKETINLWEPVRTRAQLYYLKDLNKKKNITAKELLLFSFFSKKNPNKKHKKKKIKKRRWRNKNDASETEEGLEEPTGITPGDEHLFCYSEPPWSLELCSFFLIQAGICSSVQSGVTNRVFLKHSRVPVHGGSASTSTFP